ncbi:hypothetical protein GCM10009681_10480 [Luedemannella helvata]|uniref:Transposase IS4-like domain-containing protein n=1 Tax=Luedemannella helvata TaxID=349315 RepID=A0ABN2JWT8_9ACTN
MDGVRIRHRVGRPRTRPGRVLADKAYTNRKIRTELRRRRITAVIPEKKDQIAARKAKGSRGGRPPAFDRQLYKQRNVVERAINKLNSSGRLPPATTSESSCTRPPSTSPR